MEDIQQDLISRFDTGGGSEASEQSHDDSSSQGVENAQPEQSPQGSGGNEGEDRPKGNQEIVEQTEEGEGDSDLPPHLEKRLKDTYSNYTKERQARLELERTVAQLQGQMQSMQEPASKTTSKPAADSDVFKEFRENFDDDPEAAIEKLIQDRINSVEQQINEVGSREQRKEAAKLDQQEAEARSKYDDYDEVMVPFVELLKSDPKIHEAWVNNGRTAEAAYQLARRKATFDKYLQTGELPTQEKSENGEPTKPPKRRGRTLSNVQSQSPAPVAKSGPAAGIPTHPSQFGDHLFGNR